MPNPHRNRRRAGGGRRPAPPPVPPGMALTGEVRVDPATGNRFAVMRHVTPDEDLEESRRRFPNNPVHERERIAQHLRGATKRAQRRIATRGFDRAAAAKVAATKGYGAALQAAADAELEASMAAPADVGHHAGAVAEPSGVQQRLARSRMGRANSRTKSLATTEVPVPNEARAAPEDVVGTLDTYEHARRSHSHARRAERFAMRPLRLPSTKVPRAPASGMHRSVWEPKVRPSPGQMVSRATMDLERVKRAGPLAAPAPVAPSSADDWPAPAPDSMLSAGAAAFESAAPHAHPGTIHGIGAAPAVTVEPAAAPEPLPDAPPTYHPGSIWSSLGGKSLAEPAEELGPADASAPVRAEALSGFLGGGVGLAGSTVEPAPEKDALTAREPARAASGHFWTRTGLVGAGPEPAPEVDALSSREPTRVDHVTGLRWSGTGIVGTRAETAPNPSPMLAQPEPSRLRMPTFANSAVGTSLITDAGPAEANAARPAPSLETAPKLGLLRTQEDTVKSAGGPDVLATMPVRDFAAAGPPTALAPGEGPAPLASGAEPLMPHRLPDRGRLSGCTLLNVRQFLGDAEPDVPLPPTPPNVGDRTNPARDLSGLLFGGPRVSGVDADAPTHHSARAPLRSGRFSGLHTTLGAEGARATPSHGVESEHTAQPAHGRTGMMTSVSDPMRVLIKEGYDSDQSDL